MCVWCCFVRVARHNCREIQFVFFQIGFNLLWEKYKINFGYCFHHRSVKTTAPRQQPPSRKHFPTCVNLHYHNLETTNSRGSLRDVSTNYNSINKIYCSCSASSNTFCLIILQRSQVSPCTERINVFGKHIWDLRGSPHSTQTASIGSNPGHEYLARGGEISPTELVYHGDTLCSVVFSWKCCVGVPK